LNSKISKIIIIATLNEKSNKTERKLLTIVNRGRTF